MEKLTARDFKVNYYEQEKGTREIWVVESHLEDDQHDIVVFVEIDMVQMIITDATIKFNRFPMDGCPSITDKALQMKGLKIDNNFSRNAMKIFMGPEGCPNIMSLLHISVPGIIYYYYPHKLKTGEMTHQEWDHMVRTELKNACLAHTLLESKK